MIWELSPFISRRVWGGRKLIKFKNLSIPFEDENGDGVGETWEVSTYEEGASRILSSQQSLRDLVDLNYLIKFLDTSDVLSIQVHPDDAYSKKHEGQKGKAECWIVLEADLGSGIYLGLKSGMTKNKLREGIQKNKDISSYLNFYPVKAGDFFFIPPGALHALGKGVTLIEIQQSSGVTYRVWDWDRIDIKGKKRDLHVEKAMDVLVEDSLKNCLEYFQFREGLFSQLNNENPNGLQLIDHPDFNLKYYRIKKDEEITIELKKNKYSSLVVLSGELSVLNIKAKAYQSFIAFHESTLSITSLADACFIIVE